MVKKGIEGLVAKIFKNQYLYDLQQGAILAPQS